MRLKASAIRNLTDARYFAAYGAEWIGFCFDPESPDYLEPEKALEIKGWLHGPRYVGEFRHQDADNVEAISTFIGLDVLEFAAAEIPDALPDLPLILRLNGGESDTELSGWTDHLEALMLEGSFGLAHPATILRLRQFAPLLLTGSFQLEGLTHLLQTCSPDGLSLRGGEETQPGIKSFESLDALMELIGR